MRLIQFNAENERGLEEVAKNHGVDKERLWTMYLNIMHRNFLDDLHDIARENEEELKEGE